MWYLKNISGQKLVEPETGKDILPDEVKAFSDEYSFLRFCAVHNGSVQVVTQKEYNQYLGTFGKLSQKKEEKEVEESVEENSKKEKKSSKKSSKKK